MLLGRGQQPGLVELPGPQPRGSPGATAINPEFIGLLPSGLRRLPDRFNEAAGRTPRKPDGNGAWRDEAFCRFNEAAGRTPRKPTEGVKVQGGEFQLQ